MNVFGIGNLELIVVLLVALLVLGPGRMVDAARTLGKFWGEAQRTLRAAADAATKLDEPPPSAAPPREQVQGTEGAVARDSDGTQDATDREEDSREPRG